MALNTYGNWLAETRTENPRIIIESYLEKVKKTIVPLLTGFMWFQFEKFKLNNFHLLLLLLSSLVKTFSVLKKKKEKDKHVDILFFLLSKYIFFYSLFLQKRFYQKEKL